MKIATLSFLTSAPTASLSSRGGRFTRPKLMVLSWYRLKPVYVCACVCVGCRLARASVCLCVSNEQNNNPFVLRTQVFDVSNRKSYAHLHHWLAELAEFDKQRQQEQKTSSPSSSAPVFRPLRSLPMLVVGTKVDLLPNVRKDMSRAPGISTAGQYRCRLMKREKKINAL